MKTDTGEILLVDDKTDLLTLFYAFLDKEAGFTIERVQSTRVAYQRLERHRYDVVISNDQSPEGMKLDKLAQSIGIPAVRLINERQFSRKSHFTLKSSDIVIIEDASQRVEYPLSGSKNLEAPFRDIAHTLTSMIQKEKESQQFSGKYGDPYQVLCSAPVPMIIVSSGIIDWANEEMAHFLGYASGSLLQIPLQDIFPSQDGYTGFCSSRQAKISRSGWCRTEAVLKKKDGKTVHSRLKIQKIPNGSEIIICEDITGQNALQDIVDAYERKIHDLESQYSAIFQGMDTIVVKTDPGGHITFFNAKAEEMFGCPAGEVTGRLITDSLVSPGSRAERDLNALIADCSSTRDSVFAIYHPTRYRTEICVAWRMVALRDGDRVAGIVCIGENITGKTGSGTVAEPWKSTLLEGTDVREEVFDSVLHICIELSREGREGRKVGTSFVIGDSSEVMARSAQLTLNSFEGQRREKRMVTNPHNKECIKNFAQLDGGFVIRGDGFVEASGRRFLTEGIAVSLPPGFGTRNASVAGITALTKSIGIVVSEGAGKLTVFKDGKIVRSLAF